MTATLDEVRRAVWAAVEAESLPVEADDAGDAVVTFGMVALSLVVAEGPAGQPVVTATTVVAEDLPESPEVHRVAAETGHLFGRIEVQPTGSGRCRVVFSHGLLGEGLRAAELIPVAATVAESGWYVGRDLASHAARSAPRSGEVGAAEV